MSNPMIQVTGLGKRYTIRHENGPRYRSLRDSITEKARSIGRVFSRTGQPSQTKNSEDFWALKGIDFEIAEGDVVGIIGRNGAGKSTLLKVLSRITEPTLGRVVLNGRVASLLEVGTGFHPELTGRENIFLNGSILGMTKAEILRKFDEIVEFSGVERFLDTPVKRYSSGMYVRLAFAVASSLEPEILVVDEVLSVGDAEFQKKCLGKMRDVVGAGRTVLFVSHNMAAVQALCQSVIWLRQGQLVGIGNAETMIQQYQKENTTKTEIQSSRKLGPDLSLIRFDCLPKQIKSSDGFEFTITVKAEKDLVLEHPHVLIYTSIDMRVAILDLRHPDGDYRLKEGQHLTLRATVDRFNLVEGEYRFGIHVAYGQVRQNFMDLFTLDVHPQAAQSKIVPYEAIWRGLMELNPVVTVDYTTGN